MRYHPAVIAQAAARLQVISDGRSTLGVEIIAPLWRGGDRSYEGKPLQLEDARVFDLPEELPVIAVAASGPASARIAAELGDALFATEPEGDMVAAWKHLGGAGEAWSARVPS